MWQNLAAGALSVPTTELPNLTIDERVALLRNALTALERYRDERIAADPSHLWEGVLGRPSMVLVAPEYMFVEEGFQLVNINDLARNRFLSQTDRQRVLDALTLLSAHYGRQLVFVPGSIASRDELPGPGTDDREQRVDDAQERVRDSARLIQGRLFPPEATEYDWLRRGEAGAFGGQDPVMPIQKIRMLRAARNAVDNTAYYTAENVAYLLNNGRIVAQYAKRGDFHERLPNANPRTVFIPGVKPGRATVGGITFGIEICLDHALGVLTNAPSKTGTLPSIHLVCSASVGNQDANVLVRNGGYQVHASSDEVPTTIRRWMDGGWVDPLHPEETRINGNLLRMGVIELNI